MTVMGLRIGAVFALAAGLLALSPVASADPALRLDPATGAKPGQSITVSVEGLPANLAMVAVGQCKSVMVAPTDCNLPGALMGAADAAGVWKPNAGKSSIIIAADVAGADCTSAAGTCVIAVTSLTNPGAIIASVPLTLGSAEPQPAAAPATEAAEEDDSNSTMMIVGVVALVVVLAAAALLVALRRKRSA
ncbi:neocarzinostatin apoprotein domain-containing protein [Nocardia sp. NPDC005366]|uniref:neocarzinostatin apoprotein domain-containing protein n=1 Tax=Nocardia sp. NPDC005366 TaxID=3156878 RepID=UPI0033B03387